MSRRRTDDALESVHQAAERLLEACSHLSDELDRFGLVLDPDDVIDELERFGVVGLWRDQEGAEVLRVPKELEKLPATIGPAFHALVSALDQLRWQRSARLAVSCSRESEAETSP